MFNAALPLDGEKRDNMDKKRILFLYLAYPFALASYFRHALEKREDIELVTCGAYTGDFIPWGNGTRLPAKYVKPVDLALPQSITNPTWEMIKNKLGDRFDLILNVDAGFHLANKPNIPYAVVGTDPHVLQNWYGRVRPVCDYFFNMQRYYMVGEDIHLPYACSPDHHYPLDAEKDYDASLIGLHYEQRDRLVQALRNSDYKVMYDLGIVYDEYREQNNRAVVGLNWSSLMDINARTFEIMAMKQVPLINRLPHLEELGFEEGEHYLGFETVDEAVGAMNWAKHNPGLARNIAENGYNLVKEKHTYELRVEQILRDTGLI